MKLRILFKSGHETLLPYGSLNFCQEILKDWGSSEKPYKKVYFDDSLPHPAGCVIDSNEIRYMMYYDEKDVENKI